jgi:hypothetical protein
MKTSSQATMELAPLGPKDDCKSRVTLGTGKNEKQPRGSCLRDTNQDRPVHAGRFVLQQFRSDLDKKSKSQRGHPQPGGLYGAGREFSGTRLHAVS